MAVRLATFSKIDRGTDSWPKGFTRSAQELVGMSKQVRGISDSLGL